MVDARPVAAIGNFDGVHKGHQRLLRKTVGLARRIQGTPAAIVFEPHPRRYFRPAEPPFLITSPERRNGLLKHYGADDVFILPFNVAMAALTPEGFVNDILKGELNLSGVVTGSEFRFGQGRAGDAESLKALCAAAGVETLLVTPKRDPGHGEKTSSSSIRDAIRAGDVRDAAVMMGHPWVISGVVGKGQQLGRTLGFPTANLSLGDLVAPRAGVYAVDAILEEGVFPAVANYGRRPTVGADAPLLEVHLFDFEGDLYGRPMEVSFVDFIRDERKFDGLDALKAQIASDCRAARHILTHRH